MIYGTLSTLDTLAASQQSVASFGEDAAFRGVQQLLDAHNALLMDAMNDFVETTEDRQRRYGGGSIGFMDEVDQFGRADASKLAQGVTVGFPLRKFQKTLQWTRDYFEVTTGAEFMGQVDAMLAEDAATVQRQIKRALFTPTNATFNDVLVDNVALSVKALVNADSAEIPPGPNGEAFVGASHTHYLFSAAWNAAAADALIATVVEHFGSGTPVLEINAAQETLTRAFTGFAAVVDARIISANTATIARGDLDVVNFNNRMIGVYGGAEVWVKSARVPANYQVAWMRGVTQKPLVMRRRNAARGALRLVADNENYPLRAQTREREYGIGVYNRVAAAVNFSNGGSYPTPTF
jgi:hypothetical protein